MLAKDIGDRGEDIASVYLENNSYSIIDRNWKTRWCEIDIIARKAKRIYFIEVKYRKNDAYGSGLEYITSKKQQQMQFAAELWLQYYSWKDEVCLAAISINGSTGEIDFIDEL